MVDKAIGYLFMSRDAAHRAHLKTPKYSRHMALGDFYDEIVELADKLAEGYQGRYGIMNDIPVFENKEDIMEPATMLENHCKQFERLVKGVEDRYLQNIIDEIVALYASTVYKCRYLS